MNKRYLYRIVDNKPSRKTVYQFEREYPESYHVGETIYFEQVFVEHSVEYSVVYTITGIHHSPVEKIIILNVERRRK